MFWDNETCAGCGKSVTSENGYKLSSVTWEQVQKDGSKRWGEDSSSFCSLECLFKWAWDLMVPGSLLFSMEHPKSVVDVEAELAWKDIRKRRAELLRRIGVSERQ